MLEEIKPGKENLESTYNQSLIDIAEELTKKIKLAVECKTNNQYFIAFRHERKSGSRS